MERSVDSYIPHLFVDKSYFKVRDGIKYVNKAFLVVAGIRKDEYREILGARVADAEHELTGEGIFSDMKDRGLTKVDLVISDGHAGIQSAASRMFPSSSWQMCHVHVRQEAVVWIAEQPDFPSVWDVPTVACGSGNGTV